MGKYVYVIVYFRNGEYFMVSPGVFKSRVSASRVAETFCEGLIGDKGKWTYELDKLIMC